MKYPDILELKKRMEFNLTEHETLAKLVGEAINKGETVQKDMKRLREIASKIGKIVEEKKLLFTESEIEKVKLKYKTVVGIDGSFQIVGGAGGKWYAPISVARIIFENGPRSKPHVDIYWAGIEEIIEQYDPKPNTVASVMMLSGESKAILNWGTLNKKSFIFIDGPVVDPPVLSHGGKDYIRDRCEGIKKCLDHSLIIGCVKRSRDKFFIDNITNSIADSTTKGWLKQFPSDQHLMAYIFANFRSKGYLGPIFTNYIDISSSNKVNKLYKERDVYIACLFFQNSVMSQVLRLDVPFLVSPEENDSEIKKEIMHTAKAVNEWTYPGHDIPVPVFLAHEKCNIREGCAETLYDEIMTKSRTTDPINQTILTQLR